MQTKTEKDGQHPASNYLVAVDPDDTSTWHLRVRNTFGQPDFKLMGEAWAALHGGFRGNKYEGPYKDEAIQKLTELYHYANMRIPGAKNRGGDRFVICNREAKARSEWIHIVPAGELPNKEAGIVQVLDDTALDSIYNRLHAEHTGADAPGLYAGREHFIYDPSQDSEALAWFKVFNRDEEGIWASTDGLTDIGREAVKNRRYKYTSFVADGSDLEKIEGNRYRVMGIETVGFTNMANGKKLLTPIMNRGATNDAGLSAVGIPIAPSVNQWRKSQSETESVDPTAVEKWFECVAHILQACKSSTGRHFNFASAWSLAKAKNPDVYREAFGAPTDDRPATSEDQAKMGLKDVAAITNRISNAAPMGFSQALKFVQEYLPQIFNRQYFKPQATVANRAKEKEDNMAGIQKQAMRYFFDLVAEAEERLGIPKIQALTHVANRETALCDLANYKISPREAFERAPELRGKLLGDDKMPDDTTVLSNAKQLFNRMVKEKMSAGASQLAATMRVQGEQTILCKLINREITPKGAFVLEPGLREKLK